MKLCLTSDEMLQQWRLRRALLPLRNDCEVQRTDGIDIDTYLRAEMRAWYLGLLDTALTRYLSLDDIAADVPLTVDSARCVTVKLPDACRRVISVRLQGWERPATIVTDPLSDLARMQHNPFSRGGTASPVAVLDGSTLQLYSAPASAEPPRLRQLLCVITPDEGLYTLDESALSLIPPPPDFALV